LVVSSPAPLHAAQTDVQNIIQKSVEANARDFEADPHFNYKERDKVGNASKTFQIYMIAGSPYQRLIALNGRPLSAEQKAEEEGKERQARQTRQAESPEDRRKRIAKYEKERRRDHALMEQLTEAFDFRMIGQHKLKGFNVYVLKATPKPDYRPRSMETQVLKGMQGEMWIDQKTYQWVRVTAQVITPVSIEGFLARVEPGTRFELEKMPVEEGSIWLTSHFAMRSSARVLFMFNRSSQEDDTFWDYQRCKGSGCAPPEKETTR
jgi:hypothetical protein